MVTVAGADVLDVRGVYDDGWCEAAASLRLRPRRAPAMLRCALWTTPEAGHRGSVRFAVQVDLHDPLVFDLAQGVVTHVRVACADAVGREVIVSMLCDNELAERGDDIRPLSFRLIDLSFVAEGDEPEREAPARGAGSAAGLEVRSFQGGRLRGAGAAADSIVTVSDMDGEVGRTSSELDGSFSFDLRALFHTAPFCTLRLEAVGVEPLTAHVFDPLLMGVPSPLKPRDPLGRSPERGALLAAAPPPSPEHEYLLARKRKLSRAVLARFRRRAAASLGQRKLSIIMVTQDVPLRWLRTSIESVLAQWCPNWELMCVDDSSADASVLETLQTYANADDRVRVLSTERRTGKAAALNLGLNAADGEFIAFLDQGDLLESTAVWRVLTTASASDVDLLYSDELLTTENIDEPRHFIARPAFSHDYYLDHPYFVHFVACRRLLANDIGGFDETLPAAADVDFIVRFLERARFVAHIPEVLYRWRTHRSGTQTPAQPTADAAMVAILDRFVKRIDPAARASIGLGLDQFRVDWPDRGGRVLIVIPTKNRGDLLQRAISSIEVTCPVDSYKIVVIDHASDEPATQAYLRSIQFRHTIAYEAGEFNFAAMNNRAARTYGADYPFILFMNNDVEAIAPNWLHRLRSLAARSDVAAVCPLLLYPGSPPEHYNNVQHGGVIVGFGGVAEHAFKGVTAYAADGRREVGYNCSLNVVREYSAVTGACLLMRRELFERVGGFDETLRVAFNDTDLCLRLGQLGYKVLYDGHTVLYHHESATRRPANLLNHEDDNAAFVRRWAAIIERGDDFYSPLLAGGGIDHVAVRASDDARSRAARIRRAGFSPVELR